jgi:hypothetical protein
MLFFSPPNPSANTGLPAATVIGGGQTRVFPMLRDATHPPPQYRGSHCHQTSLRELRGYGVEYSVARGAHCGWETTRETPWLVSRSGRRGWTVGRKHTGMTDLRDGGPMPSFDGMCEIPPAVQLTPGKRPGTGPSTQTWSDWWIYGTLFGASGGPGSTSSRLIGCLSFAFRISLNNEHVRGATGYRSRLDSIMKVQPRCEDQPAGPCPSTSSDDWTLTVVQRRSSQHFPLPICTVPHREARESA